MDPCIISLSAVHSDDSVSDMVPSKALEVLNRVVICSSLSGGVGSEAVRHVRANAAFDVNAKLAAPCRSVSSSLLTLLACSR